MGIKPVDVLTPLAAAALFERSPEAVRTAVRKGHVETAFTLSVTNKDVHLIYLDSAVAYWGKNESYEVNLVKFKANGNTISVDSAGYRMLHPVPLVASGGGENYD